MDEPVQPVEDRVYSSRKFVIALISIVVITLFGLACVKLSVLIGVYPTFIGGILGIAGIYITGNVANDFLNNKVKASVQVEHIKVVNKTTTAPDANNDDQS